MTAGTASDAARRTVRRMFGRGGVVVALDTASGELQRRLRAAGLPADPATLTAYRSMLLEAPGLAEHAGAVVLRPEDLDPDPAAAALRATGVLVGVRMDTGWEEVSSPRDLVTSGLDGLRARLRRSRDGGAAFAVWSVCTATADDGLAALTTNSQAAARFARTCQSVGVVPVLRVGSRMPAGPVGRRRGVLAAALLSVTGHLADLEVDPCAVVVGTTCDPEPAVDPLGRRVLDVLPGDLGGLALGAVRAVGRGPGEPIRSATAAGLADLAAACVPTWPVTFYLGREVTLPALRAWRGVGSDAGAAHRAMGAELAVASAALRRGRGPAALRRPLRLV